MSYAVLLYQSVHAMAACALVYLGRATAVGRASYVTPESTAIRFCRTNGLILMLSVTVLTMASVVPLMLFRFLAGEMVVGVALAVGVVADASSPSLWHRSTRGGGTESAAICS